MTKTTYLYGDNFDATVLETQKSIARYKIQKASELLNDLLSVNMYARDDERINAVLKAQRFNHKLLEEIL